MSWVLQGSMAAWLFASAVSLWAAWRYQRGLGRVVTAEKEVAVAVIAPVKGASPLLAEFLVRLRTQHYGAYRVIAVTESEEDPATPILRLAAQQSGAPMTVLIAGLAQTEGQKVHNLLHAMGALQPRDEIVAFVDADTLPRVDWLTRLVRPLVRGGADAVAGNRWFVPLRPTVASGVVAAANISVVTTPRIWDAVWGGSTAMTRTTIAAIDLERRWRGAIVDDVQLTSVLREHRLRILSPRDLLVISPVDHTWSSALSFGRRQYRLVRWYLPVFWCLGSIALLVPVAGFLSGIMLAIRGDRLAVAAIVAAFVMGQVRSSFRQRIATILWGDDLPGHPRVAALVDRWLPLVWVPFHAVCAVSAALSRRLWWAGTLYEVRGRNRVRVVRRLAPGGSEPAVDSAAARGAR